MTGGAGLIGSHIVDGLIDAGAAEVRVRADETLDLRAGQIEATSKGHTIDTVTGVEARNETDLQRNMSRNPGIDPMETRKRAWRGAEIPAAGGTGNARSVAEIHAILANGGVAKGKRFLSEKGCRRALDLQIEGTDLILNMPVRFGMGFGLGGGHVPLPSPNCIFWGGYGGSVIIIDMDKRATYAYAMNKMAGTTTGDARAYMLMVEMWKAG